MSNNIDYLWYRLAETMEREYGAQYDRDEEFFVCPECGEPIYKCDWQIEDYCFGKITSEFYCPVCEELLHSFKEENEEMLHSWRKEND